MIRRPKILIVNGYHPQETFAVSVGERLSQDFSDPDIKIAEFTGNPDRNTSTTNLRRFIKRLDPKILSIILHGDDEIESDVAIVYYARSKQEKRRILKYLFDFVSGYYNSYSVLVIFDIFITPTAKYGLIDIEFNSAMGLEKAVSFLKSFSQYLLKISI